MTNVPLWMILGLGAGTALTIGFLLGRRSRAGVQRRAELAEARAESYLQAVGRLSAAAPGTSRAPGESRATPSNPAGGSPKALEPGYLFISFEEEIRRARDRGTPLTLVALSVAPPADGEQAPDRTAPDRLLRRVAHAVRGQMRGCDTCVRYAADEFILILPDVSREEARQLERRIRVAVQGISFETPGGLLVRPRANLGSATFPEEGSSFDQLFTLADTRRRRDRSGPATPASDSDPSSPYRVPPAALSSN